MLLNLKEFYLHDTTYNDDIIYFNKENVVQCKVCVNRNITCKWIFTLRQKYIKLTNSIAKLF